jgi:NAD(P)H-nitrite reductase large subunit
LAKFSYSYIVCECKKVSLGEILYAIEQKGAKNIKDIQDMTDAGTACKCCISKDKDFGETKMSLYIEDILKKQLGTK